MREKSKENTRENSKHKCSITTATITITKYAKTTNAATFFT